MSMNEFDQEPNKENNALLPHSGTEQDFPPDFEVEDLVFAHELNSIFSTEREELPPYFVQTLLASEDQLFNPVEPGFEHKTRAQVFRRLNLHRRLFHPPRSTYDAFISGMRSIYARGSFLITAFVFMLIMAVTVAFTAPSFASGMAILLQGSHGGVYQVSTYPKGVHTFLHHHRFAHNNANNQPEQLTALTAEQQLHFKIYYPQSVPHNYTLDSLSLYHGAQPLWINGPVIELVYGTTGIKTKGTGQIVIREFLPTEEVLPVVLDKAVHRIQVDQYGQPAAIFINGQWQLIGKNSYKWFFGGRSELIYQQNGVLFWIAGDQNDGIGEKVLWKLAQSMSQTIPFNHYIRFMGDKSYISQANLSDISDPFTHDPLKIFPDDNPESAYYVSVDYDQSTTPIPTQIGGHSH
jgi:hypothetical protein